MNGRDGFGKPPAPPQSSTEKFLSSELTNRELVGFCTASTAFSGVFTFGAKVLKDDLKESISDSIKPLAADVAAMKNDLAAVQEIRTDVASLKTSTAFLSNNVAALDVLLVAVLGIALYLNMEETKKIFKELADFNKKKR